MDVAAAQWNLANFTWSLAKPSIGLGRIDLLRVMWWPWFWRSSSHRWSRTKLYVVVCWWSTLFALCWPWAVKLCRINNCVTTHTQCIGPSQLWQQQLDCLEGFGELRYIVGHLCKARDVYVIYKSSLRMAEDPDVFLKRALWWSGWDALCHSAAWVRRLDGARALVACWWRWNPGLVFPFAGWMFRVTTWLQDVTCAFFDKDHKKQTVQKITTLDGECDQVSMVSFRVWQCND